MSTMSIDVTKLKQFTENFKPFDDFSLILQRSSPAGLGIFPHYNPFVTSQRADFPNCFYLHTLADASRKDLSIMVQKAV